MKKPFNPKNDLKRSNLGYNSKELTHQIFRIFCMKSKVKKYWSPPFLIIIQANQISSQRAEICHKIGSLFVNNVRKPESGQGYPIYSLKTVNVILWVHFVELSKVFVAEQPIEFHKVCFAILWISLLAGKSSSGPTIIIILFLTFWHSFPWLEVKWNFISSNTLIIIF